MTDKFNKDGRRIDAKGKWLPGTSGNPNGKPKGARNKLTLVKEAVMRGEGLSPAEMLHEIAMRNFATQTTTGDNIAMKAIVEMNKYIEVGPDKDSQVDISVMTDEELQIELRRVLGGFDKDK